MAEQRRRTMLVRVVAGGQWAREDGESTVPFLSTLDHSQVCAGGWYGGQGQVWSSG